MCVCLFLSLCLSLSLYAHGHALASLRPSCLCLYVTVSASEVRTPTTTNKGQNGAQVKRLSHHLYSSGDLAGSPAPAMKPSGSPSPGAAANTPSLCREVGEIPPDRRAWHEGLRKGAEDLNERVSQGISAVVGNAEGHKTEQGSPFPLLKLLR